MQKRCYILMADIQQSRKYDADELMKNFKALVKRTNELSHDHLLVELSISLGDECQAMFDSLQSAVLTILNMEEELIHQGGNYKLRYVLEYGKIDSNLYNKQSFEMMGEGLINARDRLQELKRNKRARFSFELGGKLDSQFMNNAFFVLGGIIDKWKWKDFPMISSFIKEKDYKLVAKRLKKDTSLVWRREQSLKIREYLAIKSMLIQFLDLNQKKEN